ncbi:MAG: hypothetical protein JW958_09935 [Candidatus Eisenbacteria bacterium]|nr:hypothetical protein [Candidatus Eisenbacteria bacterium]
MTQFLVNVAACLTGLLLARWMTGRKEDIWSGFWGICAVMMVSALYTMRTFWLLPAVPLFLYLLYRRRGNTAAG